MAMQPAKMGGASGYKSYKSVWSALPPHLRCLHVMATIRRGYTLKFTWRPPWYAVRSEDAQVLCAEVINLLVNGAIEIIPPAQSESSFYSCYFLTSKKDGGLRPILDLRLQNHARVKRSFRMITLKQILSQICPGDWFMSLDHWKTLNFISR